MFTMIKRLAFVVLLPAVLLPLLFADLLQGHVEVGLHPLVERFNLTGFEPADDHRLARPAADVVIVG